MEKHIIDILLPLVIGWLLDLAFGDPQKLPHLVVYMGKWIAFFEKHLNKGRHRLLKGALFSTASTIAVFAICQGVLELLAVLVADNTTLRIAVVLLKSILVFFCLAGHTLRREVEMVFMAVDISLANGRKQVARIVGRDTNELSANEVRTAALETLAENLSDGVVAPVFWYALLGVPGMVAYKMVNTMDSMIGYQNARFKKFGCWAAHTDDVANFLPARLTALLMVVVSHISINKRGSVPHMWKFVRTYGPRHASPNSGWPEAALAGILNCRFGGPHKYFGQVFDKPYIGNNLRELGNSDLLTSIGVCFRTELACIVITLSFLAL